MDHEAALALARQVGEIAAAHAAEGEANGSLHPDVVNAMVETGLIKLLRPKLFGGYELQPWTYVEVVRELGRYDPAAAWVYSIFEIHEWWLAYANPALQEEIWGVERPGLIVDAIAPVGRAERVDGGWKVAGRWKFLSGIDWAEWVAVDALAQFRPEGPPEPALFVLKKDQVRVERDWNVVGMRGTASNSVTVEDAVVPEHRVLPLMPVAKGGIPFNPKLQDRPLYRTQFVPMLATAIYAPALGGTQRAIELYRDWVEQRIRPYALGAREKEAPAAPLTLAEASVLFDAVQALSYHYCRELQRRGEARQSQDDPVFRARCFAQRAWMSRTCATIVERLFLASGGSALYADHPLQKIWRDIHAAAQHVAVIYEDGLASLGQVLLGGPGHPLL
ncbi:acyl-CoA dehydrogenase family protein [Thermomicrobium roseum]|jgi:3-hydroxy-9,10-secoandrosta-1,3,5(10)-triene-9,17-dione monooxygenase|uniref:Pigment production hydroxylase n=1 Tax=Thermomicrobium roseum (strain ATCC 27502 / DSM 5159 / P-2) TaxID=309801 RepID=B9L564_THERP|nr:acyl-CoA dehydrogenase family protein [Thermomicrobium roseum]ACM06480.1 pigment production hydroxylase [Thermomicrobium roseum DSM 5159]